MDRRDLFFALIDIFRKGARGASKPKVGRKTDPISPFAEIGCKPMGTLVQKYQSVGTHTHARFLLHRHLFLFLFAVFLFYLFIFLFLAFLAPAALKISSISSNSDPPLASRLSFCLSLLIIFFFFAAPPEATVGALDTSV